jgi:hypothetical protein
MPQNAECLTTLRECDNNGSRINWLFQSPAAILTGGVFSPVRFREDGMDFEKDNFEEDNELAPLEEEEAGDVDEVVGVEVDEIVADDDADEEPEMPKRGSAGAPSGRAASKPPARKPARKAARKAPRKKAAVKKGKSAKKSAGKKSGKARGKKSAKKSSRGKKKRR